MTWRKRENEREVFIPGILNPALLVTAKTNREIRIKNKT